MASHRRKPRQQSHVNENIYLKGSEEKGETETRTEASARIEKGHNLINANQTWEAFTLN